MVALDAAGERARGATLFVTLEPCAHHGTTPPCADRIVAEGVARVVVGSRDPNPEAAGGIERLRAAGVEVELVDSWEAGRQNEAWRVWVTRRRPFVTYKVAAIARRPGDRARGADGCRARRAAGSCTSFAPPPTRSRSAWAPCARTRRASMRATSRRRAASRAGSRSAAGRCPTGSELELRSGPLEDELARARRRGRPVAPARGRPDARGRVSRGRPRRQAPRSSSRRSLAGGDGPPILPRLGSPLGLSHLSARLVGEDVLLQAYVHEP